MPMAPARKRPICANDAAFFDNPPLISDFFAEGIILAKAEKN
jgi:hypothetical protein